MARRDTLLTIRAFNPTELPRITIAVNHELVARFHDGDMAAKRALIIQAANKYQKEIKDHDELFPKSKTTIRVTVENITEIEILKAEPYKKEPRAGQ